MPGRREPNPHGSAALRLKLLSVSAVTSIASGPNPNGNLLDLVAVVTLGRMVIEPFDKGRQRTGFEPWLAKQPGIGKQCVAARR